MGAPMARDAPRIAVPTAIFLNIGPLICLYFAHFAGPATCMYSVAGADNYRVFQRQVLKTTFGRGICPLVRQVAVSRAVFRWAVNVRAQTGRPPLLGFVFPCCGVGW